LGQPPSGGPLTISGPSNIAVGAGDSDVIAQYIANKSNVTWSVSVVSDGSLDPGDYTVIISPAGLLTVELAAGVVVPPGGTSLLLIVNARVGGGGGSGNTDSLGVTVAIPPGVVPCFVAGTFIRTARGEVRVEDLKVGDLVLNHDGWPSPVKWIGSRRLSARQLELAPYLSPVTITKDTFGPERPYADLLVSPQHRVVLDGWRSELLYGREAVLAPAIHLVDGERVRRTIGASAVHYVHFCLEEHDIVFSNGLCTESLLLAGMALRGYEKASREELELLFPNLAEQGEQASLATCLPVVTRHEARAYVGASRAAARERQLH